MALSTFARHYLQSNSFFTRDIIFGDFDSDHGELCKHYEDCRKDPGMFYEATRMSVRTFDYILANIQTDTEKKRNSQRDLSASEKLFLTLRYFSSGMSYRSLAQTYQLGKSTIGKTTYEILKVIWKNLAYSHMPPKLTDEDLKRISGEFFSRWQFPNCIGAIEAKSFIVQKGGPKIFKEYRKKYFSLVLQAVSDADYKFIIVDISSKENKSDKGIFHISKLNDLFANKQLNIPPPNALVGAVADLPYVLIGDETYPLKTYLMRPYTDRNMAVNDDKTLFNKRLSRARVTVDRAYAIMTNKWRIFQKAIETNDKHAELIIRVGCLLHNIVREREGNTDPDYQQYKNTNLDPKGKTSRSKRNNRATVRAIAVRNKFKDYFVRTQNIISI